MTMRTDESPRPTPSRAPTYSTAPRSITAGVGAVEDVRSLGRTGATTDVGVAVARGYDGVWARVVSRPVPPPATPAAASVVCIDARVRAEFAVLASAPVTAAISIAAAHDVMAPRASLRPSTTGYGDVPGTPRTCERVHLELGNSERALASLRDQLRAVAADDVVRAHCPHVAAAGDDLRAVGVAIVVDVFVLCPGVLAAPQMRPHIDGATFEPARASDAPFDLASLLGPLAQSAGFGLQALGGLLTNPAVVDVLAPLLASALTAALPGVGVVVAPMLPVLLPMAGRLITGGGTGLGGESGAAPFDVLGVAGAFACAVGA